MGQTNWSVTDTEPEDLAPLASANFFGRDCEFYWQNLEESDNIEVDIKEAGGGLE